MLHIEGNIEMKRLFKKNMLNYKINRQYMLLFPPTFFTVTSTCLRALIFKFTTSKYYYVVHVDDYTYIIYV